METINNILSDFFKDLNSDFSIYSKPTKLLRPSRPLLPSQYEKISEKVDNQKVKRLINQITGEGNVNKEKKIVGVVAIVDKDEVKESVKSSTQHQFYSSSTEY